MKKVENIGAKNVMKKICDRNNVSNHYIFLAEVYGCYSIVTDLNMEKMVLPAGYYFNSKNGITNKNNTGSGMYETIPVYTLQTV